MTNCDHLWVFKEASEEGEIYFCQRCLAEIQIRRYADMTEVKEISAPVPLLGIKIKRLVVYDETKA